MRFRNLSFLLGMISAGACTSGGTNRAETPTQPAVAPQARAAQLPPSPPPAEAPKTNTPSDGKTAGDSAQAGAKNEPSRSIEVVEEKYENGQVRKRAEGYRDAEGEFIPHGLTTTWYESGIKWVETHFRDGALHGDQRKWYNTGAEWSESSYDNGVEHGLWTAYHPNGEKAREFRVDHGVWDGPYVEYHKNGKKAMEVTFVRGKRQGVSTVYDEEGKVAFKTDYIDGVEQP